MNEAFIKHGAFSWTELMTTDVEAAKGFYGPLFGWEFEEWTTEGMDMSYTVVKVDGEEKGGMMNMPGECAGMPPCWGVYVTVDDVDATAAKVVELGGTVLREPADIPKVGRFAVIQDPQGAVIEIIRYLPCDQH